MNRRILNILKAVAIVLFTLLGVLCVATLLLNTHSVQQRLLQYVTSNLAERLGTRVEADSISVNMFGPSASLYGLQIDDLEGRQMFDMGRVEAHVDLTSLMERQVNIKHVEVDRMKALLVKTDSISPANYQFVIDAFAKRPDGKNDSVKSDKDKKMNIDLHRVQITDCSVSYQNIDRQTAGQVGMLEVRRKNDEYAIRAEKLNLKTDNNRPRKNVIKPKRGSFDAGHLDLTASFECNIKTPQKDSLVIALTDVTIRDSISGIDIKDMHLNATTNRRQLQITDLALCQGTTTLSIDTIDVVMPDKVTGQQLSFTTGKISGNIILADISKSFVPILKGFKMPLKLNARMNGTSDRLVFPMVNIATTDSKLTIAARGSINNLRNSKQMTIGFDVNQMKAKTGIIEKVITQLPVKRLMMDQLQRLGDIIYSGHFDVVYRRESFRGRLETAAGPLDFNFSINENDKWLSGDIRSNALKIGSVMDLADIGDVNCNASFRIDISKPRTAIMRRNKGGKLPIGTINATVDDCSYKKVHVRNIDVTVECDGAVAEGDISQRGKWRELFCHFAYTSNQDASKLKISHPGIRLTKQNKETKEKAPKLTKAEKAEKKAAEKAAKAEKKASQKATDNADEKTVIN